MDMTHFINKRAYVLDLRFQTIDMMGWIFGYKYFGHGLSRTIFQPLTNWILNPNNVRPFNIVTHRELTHDLVIVTKIYILEYSHLLQLLMRHLNEKKTDYTNQITAPLISKEQLQLNS